MKNLFGQTQGPNQLLVTIGVKLDQVVEQAAALTDHFQKSTAGVVVPKVLLEVGSQLGDFFGQESHLHFWRTRVSLALGVALHNCLLVGFGQCHK